jgi:hypothetical protein
LKILIVIVRTGKLGPIFAAQFAADPSNSAIEDISKPVARRFLPLFTGFISYESCCAAMSGSCSAKASMMPFGPTFSKRIQNQCFRRRCQSPDVTGISQASDWMLLSKSQPGTFAVVGVTATADESLRT